MATNANAQTMAIVAEIFAAFPNRFRFTSGKRTAAQNKAVGGVANSYHLTGQAADFVAINGKYPKGEKEAIGQLLLKHGYEVVFHNAGSGLHYHIEPSGKAKVVDAPQVEQLLNNQAPATGKNDKIVIIGAVALVLLGVALSARN